MQSVREVRGRPVGEMAAEKLGQDCSHETNALGTWDGWQ